MAKFSYIIRDPDTPGLTRDELKVCRWFYLVRDKYGKKAPGAVLMGAVETYAESGNVPYLGRVCLKVTDYRNTVKNWTVRTEEGSTADEIFGKMIKRSELRLFITSLISAGLEETDYISDETVSAVHKVVSKNAGTASKPEKAAQMVKTVSPPPKNEKAVGLSALLGNADLGEVKLKKTD